MSNIVNHKSSDGDLDVKKKIGKIYLHEETKCLFRILKSSKYINLIVCFFSGMKLLSEKWKNGNVLILNISDRTAYL